MSMVHAIDLCIGDVIHGEVIPRCTVTSIEHKDGWIKVWTDDRFVPKCFRPRETVDVK
jgi:hypothetical protein